MIVKTQNTLLEDTANLIIQYNGELSYDLVAKIFNRETNYYSYLQGILFVGLIAYHIPIYINRCAVHRNPQDSIKSAQNFYYTRIDEDNFIEYSQASSKITPLKRHDKTDNSMFRSGAGKRLADFEAINDETNTYEMKHGASPSGLHDSCNIIDWEAALHSYVGYRLYNTARIPDTKVVYDDFVPIKRIYDWAEGITFEDYQTFFADLSVTYTYIEQLLLKKGFNWNW